MLSPDELNMIGFGGTVLGVGFPIGSYFVFKTVNNWINRKPIQSGGNGEVALPSNVMTVDKCKVIHTSQEELTNSMFENVKMEITGVHAKLDMQERHLDKMDTVQTEILMIVKRSNGGV